MIRSRRCYAILTILLAGLFAAGPPKSAPKRKPADPPDHPPFPIPAATQDLENVLGGTKRIRDYRGKVTLLSVVGKDPNDPSGAISEPVGYVFSNNPDFQRVTVVELKGFFQVMQGIIRNRARSGYDSGEVNLVAHFKEHNLTFHPYNHNTLLIDFSGDFTKTLGIDDSIDTKFHQYLINRKGRVVWDMAQGQYPAAKARDMIAPIARKALAQK